MKYAIFADIHGNLPAFEAGLADAKTHDVDCYLFLGDYFRDIPYGNEVADVIKSIDNKYIISGNGEQVLSWLYNQDQSKWIDEQYKLAYWNYKELTQENIDYYLSLPATMNISYDNHCIHMMHNFVIFYRKPKIPTFSSYLYSIIAKKDGIKQKDYNSIAIKALLEHDEAMSEINDLPNGIYLFAHNHMQFTYKHKGKLFINPGSCGVALDGDNTASYTLLDLQNDTSYVTERRVTYDVNKSITALYDSSLSKETPIWTSLIAYQVQTGLERMGHFLMFVQQIADNENDSDLSVSNETWNKAVELWNEIPDDLK